MVMGEQRGTRVGTKLIWGKQRGIDLWKTKGNLGRDRIGYGGMKGNWGRDITGYGGTKRN